MERTLQQCMTEVSATPGVIGALSIDSNGLILSVEGKASAKCGGTISDIVRKVDQLEPSNDEYPVILLESNNRQCLIKRSDAVTLAVYKTMQ